jgi:hypothetical protein
MLGFWLCQFNIGSLAWGLCLSSTTKSFVWLFQFNISSLGCLGMFVCVDLRSVGEVSFCVISQCLTFLSSVLVCHHGI